MRPTTRGSSAPDSLADSPTFEKPSEGWNVREVHAAILREHSEPQEGYEPTPLWLIVFIGMIVFWSGFYLQRYSGGFNALVYDEHAGAGAGNSAAPEGPVDLMALGRRVFLNNCQSCHQETGAGIPGQYPPLAGSDWVSAEDPSRIIRVVLDGLTGPVQVSGATFNNTMVPWRQVLTDQEIAAVLTYVRGSWANKGAAITEAEVRAIRDKTSDRAGTAWTAPELIKVSTQE